LIIAGVEKLRNEMPAVMAKYNPFAEKAGMQKIAEQPPPKEAIKIAETLSRLGFNIHFLSSEKYVLSKLRTLTAKETATIKETFIKHSHARFMKYFFYHMPFGKKEAYAEEVRKASLERLTHLTKVCGFLMRARLSCVSGELLRFFQVLCAGIFCRLSAPYLISIGQAKSLVGMGFLWHR